MDCVPSVQLEICVFPQIEDNVKIEVGNKEEIAGLMSKKEFEEFCEIWKRVREEKKSCINTACRHNKDKKCSSEDVGNVCPKRMTEEVVKNLSFF